MLNEIKNIIHYSELTARLEIENHPVAQSCKVGHFVIVKFEEKGLRIPFTIVDSDPANGTIGIIIHRAAGLKDTLAGLQTGDTIPDLLGPLGTAFDVDGGGKTLLFAGDGAGLVPLLPIIRASQQAGNKVITVYSEQSSSTACLLPFIKDYSTIVSAGDKEITDVVGEVIGKETIDRVVMSGPTLMMKNLSELTRNEGVKATSILNMMMIDGIGLCGICRVMVNGCRLLTCIDGPSFDAHSIDFDQLLNRQRHFV
ncbi:MAG: hypothetical protein NC098_08920 [Lachnoclostridium sp.]|nr:hypothetical protein [Lachnoclostridium sp.]